MARLYTHSQKDALFADGSVKNARFREVPRQDLNLPDGNFRIRL